MGYAKVDIKQTHVVSMLSKDIKPGFSMNMIQRIMTALPEGTRFISFKESEEAIKGLYIQHWMEVYHEGFVDGAVITVNFDRDFYLSEDQQFVEFATFKGLELKDAFYRGEKK